jgi:archaemetzincin
MNRLIRIACLLFSGLLCLLACTPKKSDKAQIQQALASLHKEKAAPQPGEWLSEHKEKYQTLGEYIRLKPTQADSIRNKIYIVRIGAFTTAESQIVSKTANYLRLFYGLEVRYMRLPDTTKYLQGSRERMDTGLGRQLNASHILNGILAPVLPSDAAVLIALTNVDLYPGNDWNYIFGLASLKKRVGVWSMKRFGVPDNPREFDKCFQRTIRTATHEIGHMFSLRHCVKYECCMNGSNNLFELDDRPTYFCPDCLAKYCWNFKQPAALHLNRVKSFWQEEKNTQLTQFYNQSLEALADQEK